MTKSGIIMAVLAFAAFLHVPSPTQYLPKDWTDGFHYGKVLFDLYWNRDTQSGAESDGGKTPEGFVSITINEIVIPEQCELMESLQQEMVRFAADVSQIQREIDLGLRAEAQFKKLRVMKMVHKQPLLVVHRVKRRSI